MEIKKWIIQHYPAGRCGDNYIKAFIAKYIRKKPFMFLGGCDYRNGLNFCNTCCYNNICKDFSVE